MKALVSFFWHGPALSLYEQGCIHSFVRHGFEVQLFTYQTDLALPAGVRRRDAREFFPESEVYSYEHGGQRGSIAAFADVMRYSILAAEGGWWCDADVYCLQGVEAYQQRFAEAPCVLGYEGPERINNAVLYFAPGSAHAEALRSEALSLGKVRLKWGALGPRLVTRYVETHRLQAHVQSPETFYPVGCDAAADLLRPDQRERCLQRSEGALAVHLWNEVYRRWGLPKSLAPPQGSFLDDCLRREGLDLPDAACPPELVETLIAGFEARRQVQKWARVTAALRFRRPPPL